MSERKRKKNGMLSASTASADGAPPRKQRKQTKPRPFDEKLMNQTPPAKGSEKEPAPVKKNEPVREEDLPNEVDTYEDLQKEEEKKSLERQEEAPLVPQIPVKYVKPFNPRMVDSGLTRGWTIALFGTLSSRAGAVSTATCSERAQARGTRASRSSSAGSSTRAATTGPAGTSSAGRRLMVTGTRYRVQ